MTYSDIVVEKKGPVTWLTINKPRVKNAMGKRTLTEMVNAIEEAAADVSTYVLVLRGAEGTFCSGMDRKEGVSPGSPDVEQFSQLADKVFHGLKNFPRITVVMIDGYCMAGGLELMLCCDFAIAAEDAKIADGHINMPGFVPSAGASIYLPRIIGTRKAKEMLLSGEFISGKDAETIGLVNYAVPAEKLEQAVTDFANRFTNKSPLGLKYMKMLIDRSTECSLEAGLTMERAAVKVMVKSDDFKEAEASMAEKRKPNYTGT